jgi:TRAP-type C4-dicarboxylate transport system permease small subunit
MKKFFLVYDRFIENTLSFLYFTLIIVIFLNVVSRYIINLPFMWAEELGRYLFIWIVYLVRHKLLKIRNI